jgi:hypothetical protein
MLLFRHGVLLINSLLNGAYWFDICLAIGDDPLEVNLIETHKNFSRRSIDQLDIIKESNVLVSLTG